MSLVEEIAGPETRAGTVAGTAVPAFALTVHKTLAAAEADWRAVEATGVLTPYQRYDWVRALLAAGVETADRIAIAVLSVRGSPVAVLPLAIDRHPGLTTARPIGSSVSNGDWLAADAAFAARLTPPVLMGIFDDLARAGGIDLIRFFNQARTWQGVDNPLLALSSEPAPNNLYFATIGPTPVPYVEHRLTTKRRTNIRRSARRLEETFGRLELRRANSAEELTRQHAAFLAQRAARFAEMGVDNIFAAPAFVAFFATLAAAGFGEARPALCFHALYAGDEIVATSCGAFAGTHYSQYINSTASGPAAKYSLMGVLMAELLDELTTAGITTLDMGAGDFDYKTDWTAPQPLFHGVIALTWRGRMVKPWLGSGRAAKRLIKQNPVLWTAAQWTRRVLYRLRHLGPLAR